MDLDAVKKGLIKKISEKYGKNERMIKTMLEKYTDLGYNIKSFEKDVDDFYNNCY